MIVMSEARFQRILVLMCFLSVVGYGLNQLKIRKQNSTLESDAKEQFERRDGTETFSAL